MLQPRNTYSAEYTTPLYLLEEIDKKIADVANIYYNNIIYLCNIPVDRVVMFRLLNYKRILMYKLENEAYAEDFTVDMIASKVKILKYK